MKKLKQVFCIVLSIAFLAILATGCGGGSEKVNALLNSTVDGKFYLESMEYNGATFGYADKSAWDEDKYTVFNQAMVNFDGWFNDVDHNERNSWYDIYNKAFNYKGVILLASTQVVSFGNTALSIKIDDNNKVLFDASYPKRDGNPIYQNVEQNTSDSYCIIDPAVPANNKIVIGTLGDGNGNKYILTYGNNENHHLLSTYATYTLTKIYLREEGNADQELTGEDFESYKANCGETIKVYDYKLEFSGDYASLLNEHAHFVRNGKSISFKNGNMATEYAATHDGDTFTLIYHLGGQIDILIKFTAV